MRTALLLPILVSCATSEPAPAVSAKDVVDAAALCYHWGGEEPYDEDRAELIAKSAERDCGEALRLARAGREVAAKDPEGALWLVILANHLGAHARLDGVVTDANVEALCTTAVVEVKRRLEDAEEDFPNYDFICGKISGPAVAPE